MLELLLEHALQLELGHAGVRGAHRRDVAGRGDVGRALHGRDLERVLEEAQLGEFGGRILEDRVRRQVGAGTGALARQGAEGGEEPAVEVGIAPEAHEDAGMRTQQLGNAGPELADRNGLVDAVMGDGALDPVAPSVPDLALLVARAHEQHGAHAPALAPRAERGLGLGEAGEPVQVAAGAEGVEHVAVAEHLARRRHDQQAVAEAIEEGATTLRAARDQLRQFGGEQTSGHACPQSPSAACTASVADDLLSV